MQARLQRVQADVMAHAAKQAPLAEEAAALAERQKVVEELQVKMPDESGETQKEENEVTQ